MMEEQKLLVSVGIPTYNRPEGLRRTLDCITRQTYNNIEIIVSDNCSPASETEKIVKEYSNKDPRIKFFRQPENKGAAFNFKFVLEQATGEYFMWAADDDEWETTFIQELMKLFQKDKNIHLAFCNFTVDISNGAEIRTYEEQLSLVKNTKDFRYTLQLTLQHKIPAHLIYGIFSRDLCAETYSFMEKHDLWKYFASDQIFNLLVLLKSKLGLSEKNLYKSNVNSDSVSFNMHKGIVSEINYLKGLIKAIRHCKMKITSKAAFLRIISGNLFDLYFLIFKGRSVKLMIALNLHKYYRGVKSTFIKHNYPRIDKKPV